MGERDGAAHKFYELNQVTESFPAVEKWVLTSQLIRSANSIIANIAESHGRYHFADKIRILYISRAELEETQSHLLVALGRKYILQEKFDLINNDYEGLKIGINCYINSLNKQR